jgi:hypothetical protein
MIPPKYPHVVSLSPCVKSVLPLLHKECMADAFVRTIDLAVETVVDTSGVTFQGISNHALHVHFRVYYHWRVEV